MNEYETTYEHFKRFADGRYTAVMMLTYGRGRLLVGTDAVFYDNAW